MSVPFSVHEEEGEGEAEKREMVLRRGGGRARGGGMGWRR